MWIAASLVDKGMAIWIDGLSHQDIKQEAARATMSKERQLVKQRADQEMEMFDRQSPETREVLRETNGEPLDE